MAELAMDLRVLSDDSYSVLLEHERVLLAHALLEVESLSPSWHTEDRGPRQAPVGAELLRCLGGRLSRVIAGSTDLRATLTLMRCRDLVDAAAAGGDRT